MSLLTAEQFVREKSPVDNSQRRSPRRARDDSVNAESVLHFIDGPEHSDAIRHPDDTNVHHHSSVYGLQELNVAQIPNEFERGDVEESEVMEQLIRPSFPNIQQTEVEENPDSNGDTTETFDLEAGDLEALDSIGTNIAGEPRIAQGPPGKSRNLSNGDGLSPTCPSRALTLLTYYRYRIAPWVSMIHF